MNMFRVVLSVCGVRGSVIPAVRQVVPAGLALVGEQHMAAVVPPEPPVHSLRELPRLRAQVQPVVQRVVPPVRVRVEVRRGKRVLQTRKHIVERQSVRRQKYPTRVRRKYRAYLAWPQPIGLRPIP